MNVRAQISMMFHLDKCIGCHTCSVACKNIWTDRQGTEYMWWNNVETKPGTGYPTQWEDQEKYKGGWSMNGKLKLRATDKVRGYTNMFHQPHLPTIDDYYEPWTYKYSDLFNAPASDDQPTARPISLITGKPMEIEAGPNWDDDLSGSPIYAANDPDFAELSDPEKQALFEMERMVFFYLPRICNHCLNPGCVAACPSGALYKRGEDGIVLVNQNVCRGWRFCVSACPYKKVYYNWKSGKSEKCILCFPRLESGQAPACFHSCVGRIRYLGVVLYDADRIEAAASVANDELVDHQRDLILDPHDPEVVAQAEKDGVHFSVIESAQKSTVYRFVKEWQLALPLHPEFRTIPMLFYIPPLLPVIGQHKDGVYHIEEDTDDYFGSLDRARVPLKYMARLFAAGNTAHVRTVYEKLLAIRLFKRAEQVGDIAMTRIEGMLAQVGLTPQQCEEIYRLTSLPTFDERFVIPPMHREQAIELMDDVQHFKAEDGVGFNRKPERGL
ncbi:MAG: nitrate reductase subunit beta [Chloroflexi bacterium AL-W]|nr:nitrate reductase subunit beta [Chloroflexi bacterium AL-N1]NOK71286.1 nitrate reductase subunit beta [Chloroflexi bacterium AL-N10]NOK77661.1 nitrate reductase subunit beta [Chloroflexi bacterium AL-N5]NOK84512.1 nitrate reductase subunit beta [Chloroflexi bacterium AL-W]NOK92963.1 nitrate reductase subunit beta [Chloroflexi bacterium AL-N15]